MKNLIEFNQVKEVYADAELIGYADAKINIGGVWYPYDTDRQEVIHDNGEALPIDTVELI